LAQWIQLNSIFALACSCWPRKSKSSGIESPRN
jgi:hypothetical protein